MVKINGIPVYQCKIDMEGDTGIIRVSLVDSPAVMSNFLSFKDKEKVMQYAVSDEEKHLVLGVIMRADFPIYRYDEKSGEYYVIYTAETIRQMAQKYLKESKQNNVDLQHDGEEIEGVEMVQWFIKDSGKGIVPEGFEKIADGSLFAEYKVEDDNIWEQIKDGTYRGFSLEGTFHIVPEDNEAYVEKAVEKSGKFSKQSNKKMSKMGKFKEKMRQVAKLIMEFGSVSTDKGILQFEEDELAVGVSVMLVAEDGSESTPEDGEYLTDTQRITISEGKVTEIVELEDKESKADDTTQEEMELQTRKEAFEAKAKKGEEKFSQSFSEKCEAIRTAFAKLIPYGFYIEDAGEDFAVIARYDKNYDFEGYFRYEISFDENGEASILDDGKEVRYAFIPKDMEVTYSAEQKMEEEGEGEQSNASDTDTDERIKSLETEMDEAYKLIDFLLKKGGYTRDDADSEGGESTETTENVEAEEQKPADKDAHEASRQLNNEETPKSREEAYANLVRQGRNKFRK